MKYLIAALAFTFIFSVNTALAQEAMPDSGRVRVQIVSLRQTTLSSEISAKISGLPLREGDAFKEGDDLIVFDCALLEAQLNKTEASAEAARQTLKVNKRLLALNSISSLEVELAEAKVKETEAEVTAVKVTVSKCTLKAPFPGRISKLQTEAYQYVQTGKPLMDIIDTGSLEVRLVVPSKWVAWLKTGAPFSVRIEELNRTFAAKITRLGARIDPLSQSISVAGVITGNHPELLPGMSGWADFKARK